MSNNKQQISNDNVDENNSLTDTFLIELTRGICFAGIPHAKERERQQNLLQSVQISKRLHIAVPSNGLNLHLNLNNSNIVPEQNEVHFQSDILFNGIPIRIKGQINILTLFGVAQFEKLVAIQRGYTTDILLNDCKIPMNSIEAERRERLHKRLCRIRETLLKL
ncbi:unnamed protein product [Meloidogyne enterolobii]|uniref:Uncharacterized protein n=1 Tax=Meloidogyne enterolobii TaxID=390850 RepID=A0ACB0YIY9_MELEN